MAFALGHSFSESPKMPVLSSSHCVIITPRYHQPIITSSPPGHYSVTTLSLLRHYPVITPENLNSCIFNNDWGTSIHIFSEIDASDFWGCTVFFRAQILYCQLHQHVAHAQIIANRIVRNHVQCQSSNSRIRQRF